MAPSLSRDTVESIANETIQRYITGSSFIDIVRQAVKDAVQEKLNEFINRIEINESNILDLESRLGKREKEITELKSVIETQQNTLDTVERAVNNQEQYSRRNCLRFHGVSESEGEDTDALICQIAKEKLNVPLTKDDIERSHRLSSKKKDADQQQSGNARVTRNNKPPEKSHRVIIVKFVSYRVRKLVISRRRALKGTKMGIEEDLTKTNADLLKKTKDCSKVLAAWPSDGRILALIPASGGRTMKRLIKHESDLANI